MNPESFKRIRQQLGLSQAGLAAFLRISDKRTIRRWETGDCPISGPVSFLMEMLEDGVIVPANPSGSSQPKAV